MSLMNRVKLAGMLILVVWIGGCLPGMKNTVQTKVAPEVGKVVMPLSATMPTSRPAKIEQPVQGVGIGAAVNYHKEVGTSATSGDHSPSITFVNSQWPMVALIVTIAGMWLWERHSHHGTKQKLSQYETGHHGRLR